MDGLILLLGKLLLAERASWEHHWILGQVVLVNLVHHFFFSLQQWFHDEMVEDCLEMRWKMDGLILLLGKLLVAERASCKHHWILGQVVLVNLVRHFFFSLQLWFHHEMVVEDCLEMILERKKGPGLDHFGLFLVVRADLVFQSDKVCCYPLVLVTIEVFFLNGVQ
jgi:hypothetical protein